MVNSENTAKPEGGFERASAQAQMRKGVLELCILSILSQGDAYPTEIIDKLKDTKLHNASRYTVTRYKIT